MRRSRTVAANTWSTSLSDRQWNSVWKSTCSSQESRGRVSLMICSVYQNVTQHVCISIHATQAASTFTMETSVFITSFPIFLPVSVCVFLYCMAVCSTHLCTRFWNEALDINGVPWGRNRRLPQALHEGVDHRHGDLPSLLHLIKDLCRVRRETEVDKEPNPNPSPAPASRAINPKERLTVASDLLLCYVNSKNFQCVRNWWWSGGTRSRNVFQFHFKTGIGWAAVY